MPYLSFGGLFLLIRVQSKRRYRSAFQLALRLPGLQIAVQLGRVTMFNLLRYTQIVLMYSSSLFLRFRDLPDEEKSSSDEYEKKLLLFRFLFLHLVEIHSVFISSSIACHRSSTH